MISKEITGLQRSLQARMKTKHLLKIHQMMRCQVTKPSKLKMLLKMKTRNNILLNGSRNIAHMMVFYTLHGVIIRKDTSLMVKAAEKVELEVLITIFKSTLELKHMMHQMKLYREVRKSKQPISLKEQKLLLQMQLKPQKLNIIEITTVSMTVLSISHMEIIKRDSSLMERDISVEKLAA